jgi:hypothetical protein
MLAIRGSGMDRARLSGPLTTRVHDNAGQVDVGQVDAVGWLRSLLRPCSVDFCRRLFSLGVRVHLSLGLSGSGSQWCRGSGSQWCRHELSASVVIVCQRLDFAIGWGRTGARVPITMATIFLLFCFRMGIVAAK